MTRLSGERGVTKWLRGRRRVQLDSGAVLDLQVPEGVIVVLPQAEQDALDWDAPPTRAERNSVTVVQPVTQPDDGTQRATKKSKRKGRRR